ncbi:MAG: pyridoxal phosphate-dependent aminotransferase [Planctomycetia bacterium]|nr:pyridoxal phosphate-dependent aminotransferase [Planctomycetia bacterium]
MLRLSRLADQVKPSATLAAGAKAKEMKAAGIKVYDFTLGEPDFPTPPHIVEAAVKAMHAGHTKYTAAEGLPALRQELCKSYKQRFDLTYTPDQVIISNGAKHSLHNALAALVGLGDEVIIPTPYWTSYADLVTMTGASIVLVNTTIEEGFKLTAAKLKSAITPKTRLLMMNSPSNPTGVTYSRDELLALSQVVVEHQLAVLSDEIYENLSYDNVKSTCIASLPSMQELTIVVSGASKSFAMTGWRIGWALGPKHVIKAMGNIQSQQTGCPNSISQYAALVGLTSDMKAMNDMRAEFQARRDLICKGLASLPGITVHQPTGAFYAFFNVSKHFGKTLHGIKINDSADFCRAALEKVQVSVVPGSAFGAEGYVRLSFASSREDLQGGVEQLRKLLS